MDRHLVEGMRGVNGGCGFLNCWQYLFVEIGNNHFLEQILLGLCVLINA